MEANLRKSVSIALLPVLAAVFLLAGLESKAQGATSVVIYVNYSKPKPYCSSSYGDLHLRLSTRTCNNGFYYYSYESPRCRSNYRFENQQRCNNNSRYRKYYYNNGHYASPSRCSNRYYCRR